MRSTLVVPGSNESAVIEAVLEIADSLMTYRSRYLTTLQAAPLLDLLVTDESNPRSMAFQLAALADHVENLPRDQTNPVRTDGAAADHFGPDRRAPGRRGEPGRGGRRSA